MGELYSATTNFQTRQINTGGDYVKPSHVDFDKRFVVKVQASADTSPIFLYDETRECLFYITPEDIGFSEILAIVRTEPAWQGRKTFMKASFNIDGRCTLYPDTAGVKSHYNW